MERFLIKLQSKRVETHRQLDTYFKIKVQLQEQVEENEVKIHFYRGVVAAYDDLEKHINELQKSKKDDKDEFVGEAMAKPTKYIKAAEASAESVVEFTGETK